MDTTRSGKYCGRGSPDLRRHSETGGNVRFGGSGAGYHFGATGPSTLGGLSLIVIYKKAGSYNGKKTLPIEVTPAATDLNGFEFEATWDADHKNWNVYALMTDPAADMSYGPKKYLYLGSGDLRTVRRFMEIRMLPVCEAVHAENPGEIFYTELVFNNQERFTHPTQAPAQAPAPTAGARKGVAA